MGVKIAPSGWLNDDVDVLLGIAMGKEPQIDGTDFANNGRMTERFMPPDWLRDLSGAANDAGRDTSSVGLPRGL